MKELIEGLMGAAGRHSIEKAREILISKGFITMQRNPDPKFSFDATMHYLLNVDVVCKALFPNADFDKSGALVKISKIRVAEICKSEFAENSEAIPYTSTNTSTKSSPPASGQGDKLQKPPAKKTAPTPPREAPPPRPFWQAFVDSWHGWYKEHHRGEEPSIKGRNLSHLSKLYDLLQARAHKKEKAEPGRHPWTEAYGTASLRYFLDQAWTDTWLREHFLMENLVKQFDAVYARAALAKPENERPKGLAQSGSTRQDSIRYMVERYQDGTRLPEPVLISFYDQLLCDNLIPLGYCDRVAGDTPEERKARAATAWLMEQAPLQPSNGKP